MKCVIAMKLFRSAHEPAFPQRSTGPVRASKVNIAINVLLRHTIYEVPMETVQNQPPSVCVAVHTTPI